MSLFLRLPIPGMDGHGSFLNGILRLFIPVIQYGTDLLHLARGRTDLLCGNLRGFPTIRVS